MAFIKMIYLIILLSILPSINAGGQEDHFQTVHDAVKKMYNDPVDEIVGHVLDVYVNKGASVPSGPSTVVVLQQTNSSVYILDTSGFFMPHVQDNLVGLLLSEVMTWTMLSDGYTPETGIHEAPSDVHVLSIRGNQCYGYNLTLADSDNGTLIEAVRYDRCGGSTLTSYIVGKQSEFDHLKAIYLRSVPITELTVEDLIHFPELQGLQLVSVRITQMENRLLCSVSLITLEYLNSFGSLTIFPRQIFNCTIPLKLEYLHLQNHNITSLPAHAFGSAAEHLRVLFLVDIGLDNVHKDAFTGLTNLEYVLMTDNNLQAISGAMIPPSAHLHVILYRDIRFNRTLNLTTMQIASKSHLQLFCWSVPRISGIVGSFCSNRLKSELEIVILEGTNSNKSNSKLEKIRSRSNTSMGETLAANVFAHCVSLKSLTINNTGLAYLPDRLFSTNVSQLEILELIGNKLNSNTSWSDVLMPLHRLKYLNLSMNMLTSWTHDLSSLWSLEILDLSHNAITEISHMAFMNMTMLTYLSLEGNNLTFLAPGVQHAFAHISLLDLGTNNIHKLNMLNETMLSEIITVDISANNLTQLDMPPERKCSLSCGKISLYGDNNKLSWFVLPCSNTHQYATVSLTNNKLTEFSSIFPDVLVQQCSIETLNVSGNYLHNFDHTYQTTEYQNAFTHAVGFHKELQTHNITNLDMTRCGIKFVDPAVFLIFNIKFLDLRENDITVLPPPTYPDTFWPYPNVLDARFNPIKCCCSMLWLKRYLKKEKLWAKRENEIRVTQCMEPMWHTPMDIVTMPDIMFTCKTECPQQIHQQCDKADRCYVTDFDSERCFKAGSDSNPVAAVCLSSHNNSELSSAFIPVLYKLYISGFNLTTLKLPYVKSHNLTHLNLTSCNIRVIPNTTFIKTPKLEILVLAHNAIQTIPRTAFHPLVYLKYLDLSNNQLPSFVGEMILPLFHLKTAYLHGNKMKQLSLGTLEEFKMLDNLSLHDNPWICDCNNIFGHWILEQQTNVILLSPKSITCNGTNGPVMYYNVTCTTHVHHGSKAATLVSGVLASLLAVTLLVCILIYKYQHTLSVLAYIYMPQCTKRTENSNVRGVFAICDDKEMGARIWIKDNLIPFIECACPLLWSERTFIIGDDMADNIQNSVEQSNCAIVLLSRRFLQNEWSCCMFQAAFSEMRERKRRYKIILILTPDVTVNMLTSDENCPQDLRVMLKTQRLVYMSERFYYETLLYLLPESCRSTQQIMTVRGEDIITTFYNQQLTPNMATMLSICFSNHVNSFSEPIIMVDSKKKEFKLNRGWKLHYVVMIHTVIT